MVTILSRKPRLTPLDQWRMHLNMPKATPEQLAKRAGKDVTFILVNPPQKRGA